MIEWLSYIRKRDNQIITYDSYNIQLIAKLNTNQNQLSLNDRQKCKQVLM